MIGNERLITFINSLEPDHTEFLERLEQNAREEFVPVIRRETQQLLKATGYAPLYARLGRDSVILFALQHSLSLIEANNLLYDMNYPILE